MASAWSARNLWRKAKHAEDLFGSVLDLPRTCLYQRSLALTDASRAAYSDGGDGFGLCGEFVPSLANRFDDVVEGFEDAIGEPISAYILDRIELRGARWKPDRRDVFGHEEVGRRVPAGAIEDQHGVRAGRGVGRDLIEMKLHRLGVGARERQRRADAAGRTSWRRTDRRSRNAGRPAGAGAFPVAPIAAPGRSSGRRAPHPYMRLPLSKRDRALATMVARWISRRTVVDWGSSYPQRALHNLTYGPIARAWGP
jgi:hypothetical protein